VSRNIIVIIIPQFNIGHTITLVSHGPPGIFKSDGYVFVNKLVEKFEIEPSYEIREGQNVKFFKEGLSVVIVFFTRDNPNCSLLFRNERLTCRR
jgi:hypothetical protein